MNTADPQWRKLTTRLNQLSDSDFRRYWNRLITILEHQETR